MEQTNILTQFFKAIADDPRIGVSHISLFCALLQACPTADCNTVILVKSTELMKTAKILGRATYHRCIRELHEFGYILYKPTYNHRKKNKVYLLNNLESQRQIVTR